VLTRVDHIDLKVPDLDVALDFFTTMGFVEVRRTPARGSVEVALPGERQVIFELREDPTLDRFVMDHIAFGSTDQAADAAALTAAGRPFSRTNTFIPVTGKTISDFTDPYGSRWQLSD
jgi:methylmalonyl-CoA/ethylmalonyl-CoA epimerase